MNVIKLNNLEVEVESYNKNTYLNDGVVMSTAYCTLKTNDTTALNAMMLETITSIEIKHDGTVIYSLGNLNARIDSITESLTEDRVVVNLNLAFSNT